SLGAHDLRATAPAGTRGANPRSKATRPGPSAVARWGTKPRSSRPSESTVPTGVGHYHLGCGPRRVHLGLCQWGGTKSNRRERTSGARNTGWASEAGEGTGG